MNILASVPTHQPDIAWRAIADEGLLVDPRTGKIYPLDPVGLRLWQMCDGTRKVSEIVQKLLQEFDVTEEVLTQDVVNYVESLQAQDLLLIHQPQ